jgi:hypothetical protein
MHIVIATVHVYYAVGFELMQFKICKIAFYR